MNIFWKLKLENFQTHKMSELTFSAGVTAIIGTTDSGKSSIIRALRWVMENRPNTDTFIRKGEKACNVTLELSDGKSVSRGRGKKVNEYVVNDGEPLKALRSDVPTEVSDVLQTSSYNLQMQHEPYFLIASTPGAIAKELNDLCGITKVSEVTARANKVLREREQTEKALNTQLLSAQDKLEVLHVWGDVHDEVVAFVAEQEKLKALIDKSKQLEWILNDASGLDAEILRYNVVLSHVQLDSLQPLVQKLNETEQMVCILGRSVQEAVSCTNTLKMSVCVGDDEMASLKASMEEQLVLRQKMRILSNLLEERLSINTTEYDTGMVGLMLQGARSWIEHSKTLSARMNSLSNQLGAVVKADEGYQKAVEHLNSTTLQVSMLKSKLPICPTCHQIVEGGLHEDCMSR